MGWIELVAVLLTATYLTGVAVEFLIWVVLTGPDALRTPGMYLTACLYWPVDLLDALFPGD